MTIEKSEQEKEMDSFISYPIMISDGLSFFKNAEKIGFIDYKDYAYACHAVCVDFSKGVPNTVNNFGSYPYHIVPLINDKYYFNPSDEKLSGINAYADLIIKKDFAPFVLLSVELNDETITLNKIELNYFGANGKFLHAMKWAKEINPIKLSIKSFEDMLPKNKLHKVSSNNFGDHGVNQNPIVNYQDHLKGKKKGMKINVNQVPKNHQTLVIVYGNKDCDEKFHERAARLVGGFNTSSTIKTTTVTVNGSELISGLDLSYPPAEGSLTEDELKQLKSGFVQVVEVKDASTA